MTQVEKLEQTVEQLSPDELATFRSWFFEFDAAAWDHPRRRFPSRISPPGSADRVVLWATKEVFAVLTQGISSDPAVMMGKPVVGNTRITVCLLYTSDAADE